MPMRQFINRMVLVFMVAPYNKGWQQKGPVVSPDPMRFKVFPGFSSAISLLQDLLNIVMDSEKEKKSFLNVSILLWSFPFESLTDGALGG